MKKKFCIWHPNGKSEVILANSAVAEKTQAGLRVTFKPGKVYRNIVCLTEIAPPIEIISKPINDQDED